MAKRSPAISADTPLTARQKRFVQEYQKDLNAMQAAIRSGYSVKTAKEMGYENLTKPHIKAAIAGKQQKIAEKADLTQQDIVDELRKIGFSDIRKATKWQSNKRAIAIDEKTGEIIELVTNRVQLIDSDKIDDETAAAISEISQSATGALKVKFHDKRAALIDLGKHLGMFIDHSKTEINVNMSLQALVMSVVQKRDERNGR